MRGSTAVMVLRVVSALVMAVGLAGMVYGFCRPQSIPLFIFDVPSWAIGLSAAYMGLRYWRRIPELQRSIEHSDGFSWSNFPSLKPRWGSRKT